MKELRLLQGMLVEGVNSKETPGTTDYNELTNKPSVNGIELVGSVTLPKIEFEDINPEIIINNLPTTITGQSTNFYKWVLNDDTIYTTTTSNGTVDVYFWTVSASGVYITKFTEQGTIRTASIVGSRLTFRDQSYRRDTRFEWSTVNKLMTADCIIKYKNNID